MTTPDGFYAPELKPPESPGSATGQRESLPFAAPRKEKGGTARLVTPRAAIRINELRQRSPPLLIRTAHEYRAGKKLVKNYPRVPEWPYTRPAPNTPVVAPIPGFTGTSPVNGGRGSMPHARRSSSPACGGGVAEGDGGGCQPNAKARSSSSPVYGGGVHPGLDPGETEGGGRVLGWPYPAAYAWIAQELTMAG